MMFFLLHILFLLPLVLSQKIILTNDDGWAVAQIRAQLDALVAAGFETALSAPAQQESGVGGKSAPPTPLTQPCEFDSCPIGSPAEGFNASDPRQNYVNSFPVDAVNFGIQTVAPRLFGSPPDIVISGPNVGLNPGRAIQISGTVGAATAAARTGIPSIAFSAAPASQVSYTTLTSEPTSNSSIEARFYAAFFANFTRTFLTPVGRLPVLSPNVTLNVNFLAHDDECIGNAGNFKYIFARVFSNATAMDVQLCDQAHLPDEVTVISKGGCLVTLSVIDAALLRDGSMAQQAFVLERLQALDFPLSCFAD